MSGLQLELGYLSGELRQSVIGNVLWMSFLVNASCSFHSSLSCPMSYFLIACEHLVSAVREEVLQV